MLTTLAVLGGSACSSDPSQGYSFKNTWDTQSRTIQVPIFQNKTYFKGVESELTEAIVKEIQNKTPWIIDPSPAADTTLSGTITSVQLRRTATDPSGYVQELGYIITVDFEWVDNTTGKTIVGRRNFSGADTFVPTRGVSEKIEYGQTSSSQRLAKDLVSELRTTW
ncbi:MAG: LptE family protein [Planctomycetes bacterium]|nr:LptE family protein [Planctomycetota bacterium]